MELEDVQAALCPAPVARLICPTGMPEGESKARNKRFRHYVRHGECQWIKQTNVTL